MGHKSPYNTNNHIYEHLIQSSKLSILPEELPAMYILNRKLRGKEYSSLAHAVEAAQIEGWRLGEAERCTHGEDWEQQKQHGRRREWIRQQPWTKCQPEKEQAGGIYSWRPSLRC